MTVGELIKQLQDLNADDAKIITNMPESKITVRKMHMEDNPNVYVYMSVT